MLVPLAFQIHKDPNVRITKYLNPIGSVFKGGIEEESVNLCILDQNRQANGEYFASLRRAVGERRGQI